MENVTLQTLADQLGLHVSSVSRALNNSPQVSPATREKVKAAAEALGYRPDPMLGALARYRKAGTRPPFRETLAWITAFPAPDTWRQLPVAPRYRQGCQTRAESLGYQLVDYWLDPAISGRRHADILHSRGVRGLLIAPLPDPVRTLSLPLQTFPVVAMGPTLEHPRVHRVLNDLFDNIRVAMDQLAERGYRRPVLHLSRSTDARTRHLFISAFLGAEIAGRALQSRDVYRFDQPDTEAFLRFLQRRKADVVIDCESGVSEACLRDAGLRVPEDIGLLTANLPTQNTRQSGLKENPEEAGAAAVDLLVSLPLQPSALPQNPRTVMVEGYWREGQSLSAIRDLSRR